MTFQNFIDWAKHEFNYPIPRGYLDFLEKGEFDSTERKYYVTAEECVLEISEWLTPDNLPVVYKNCREEGMIEEYHLPVLESCGCIAVLNCNPEMDAYGQIFLSTPTGYYDESIDKNVYEEPQFIAKNFSAVICNLKYAEELEEMGLF